MVKFVDKKVVFAEIPDKVTLAVNISNCRFHCPKCHSPYLRDDIGTVLDKSSIDILISENKGINCFLFLGDGNDVEGICELAKHIKEKSTLSTAIYSGYDTMRDEYLGVFDYIKVGKYIEEYGPLNKKTTNQRLYKLIDGEYKDVTYMFWNRL